MLLGWLHERELLPVKPGTSILHVAPEASLRRSLSDPGVRYIRTDLMRPDVHARADILHLPFPDRSFDAVVCNHVLEHVPDDRRAMAELRRVTRPGGWATLLVPIDTARGTIEDPAVTDPAERARVFGQSDHVRWYGSDYPERLAAAGWARVELERYADHVTVAERQRHGFYDQEVLVLAWA